MIDKKFGVSFSVKQCRNFGLESEEALTWLLKDAGFQRFRLMSYWNEIERSPGEYTFTELDRQIELITAHGGEITLCLGARQPRWPENHWPDWAWKLPKAERTKALYTFIETVVKRYRQQCAIVSYQLENEALLKAFGERPEVDRTRLLHEFNLVKKLDPAKPLIMTTSTSWGIPMRRPIPDVVGISFYQIVHRDGKYHQSLHLPALDRIRKRLVRIAHRRPFFVHELQLEPWGPTAIWKMPLAEQDKSMNIQQIARNVALAKKIKAYPIDIWGAEWWYWRIKKHNDASIWLAVQKSLT